MGASWWLASRSRWRGKKVTMGRIYLVSDFFENKEQQMGRRRKIETSGESAERKK